MKRKSSEKSLRRWFEVESSFECLAAAQTTKARIPKILLPPQLCKVTSTGSESIFLLLILVIDVSRKQICVRKLFKLLKSSKVFLRLLISELLRAALRRIVLSLRWKHSRNIYFNCFMGLFKLNKYLCTIKSFSLLIESSFASRQTISLINAPCA